MWFESHQRDFKPQPAPHGLKKFNLQPWTEV